MKQSNDMSIPHHAFLDDLAKSQSGGQDKIPLYELPIGNLIREIRKLSDNQVNEILAYQRTHNVRFGEAAVALKYVSSDEVLRALSRQFAYA